MGDCDYDAARRVAAGAAWLDEHRPGWWRGVKPGYFDVGDCRPFSAWGCSWKPQAHGFAPAAAGFRPGDRVRYREECDALTREWRAVVRLLQDRDREGGHASTRPRPVPCPACHGELVWLDPDSRAPRLVWCRECTNGLVEAGAAS